MKLQNLIRLNWPATIRLNYHFGGLLAILQMPIKVYGSLSMNLQGQIILPKGAKRNTLIIGSLHEDYTATSKRAQLNLYGTWQIDGMVRIGPDSFVGVDKNARLEMRGDCHLGRDTQIHCFNHIVFGNGVFAGELYATDSDAHTIIKDYKPQDMLGKVVVGDGAYLGFRTMLLKGTNIPPYSVVATGSVCNKDYCTIGPEKLLLAGVPAKAKHTCTTAKF